MTKDSIEDLLRTARNKSNPYLKRKQAVKLAKYDIKRLLDEIAEIEWSWR